MNQLELEPVSVSDYYIDQAAFNLRYKDLNLYGSFTTEGIKSLDSDFCCLIQNLITPVKQVYSIDRLRENYISRLTGKETESIDCVTQYNPTDLDKGRGVLGVRVEWYNGCVRDFYDERPVFDLLTRMSDPIQLKKEIIENPHLHVKIKENLLNNLASQLASLEN